jgi:CubicO group peptidase (beta-lactamase class C family)
MRSHARKLSLNTVAIAIILVLSCSALFAGIQKSIAGHWEGAITLPSGTLAISVDFAAEADGKLSATITIPQQGARDLPLSNVSQAGSDVTWDIPNVPGEPKFRGKLNADGTKIEGIFSQGGGSLACVLDRKADPGVAAKDSLKGLDEAITNAMRLLEVPGLAVAIVKNKEVIYAKGFGYRDVEKQAPVTADTLFAIGSSTKAFTTFVLGTLVDEGRVDWDKPVRTYIPWFKLYDPSSTERLSVRDLVTHRSGLPRHDLVWYNNFDTTREAFVRKLAWLEPSADLRVKWQYNNLMFLTAGYLTEVMTGKTWEDAVRDRILNPLGMKRTNFSVADSQKDSDFAFGYTKRDGKVSRISFRPITNIGPAGAINSSVNEMARWVTTHLNGGKYGETRLANAATVDEMHQAQMVTGSVSPDPNIIGGEYGMGWFLTTYRGHRRVEHGGNIDGFSASVALLPKDGLGWVVLTNMNGTPLPGVIGQVIADKLLNLDPIDWVTQAAARRNLSEQANKEGEAKKEVARILGTKPSRTLADFAGEYEHPGYGVLRVALNGDKLEATFNGIVTPLEHWHYDTFSGGTAKDNTFVNMKYTFQTDASGYVASIAVPFEPSVKEIVFAKKPDARLSNPSYLAKYAGDYVLTGQPISISLKGDQLVMNVPGQPAIELIPTLSGDFAMKQTRIVTLHFITGDKAAVSAFELRQPGTTLTATRK